MGRLFEAFVKNLYRLEQDTYRVRPSKINWQVAPAGDAGKSLPEIKTDVCLINGERKIIIDRKYYRETLQKYRTSRLCAQATSTKYSPT